jgi:hypothetical protein
MSREADFEIEQVLRAQALDVKSPIADRRLTISILADFYEERGQLSRAALWREQIDSDQRRGTQEAPDLQTRSNRPQAFDRRRNQMMWLLRQQGLSVRKVGAAFGLSATRVEQIVALEDQRIRMHAAREHKMPTMRATERLNAAGALRGEAPWSGLDLGADLPEDWPAEHKRRRK